ncbi:type IV secretion system protein TraC [Rhodanobacter denitrificans]|uniref:type IV secretion system protein TraC n=1 Tax=Rhodanobacter denitrificans TaxID=666685 RepID=UPI001F47E7BA|nr:type IV secretion system protein TraC [Rhodanobacter denitrificans]UJJ60574.1 type IV secretion system protein TraC [Rhodanobacter denitrificans]
MPSYAERQEALIRQFGVVHAFDADEGLFVISPDRIGFGAMASPLSGIDTSTMEALNTLLNVPYPTGALLQVMHYASPDIESTIWDFNELRKHEQEPTLRMMSAERVRYLRELTLEPAGQVAGARLRQLQVMICVSLPHGTGPMGDAQLQKIRELRQNFEAALKAVRLPFRRLTNRMYVRFMETVLNHSPNAIWRRTAVAECEEDVLLCNQILDPDTAIEYSADAIKLGEHAHVRVMSVKRYPDSLFPGMAQYYMGDIMRGTKAMRDPVLYTVNILYPDHESRRSALTNDFGWATKNASGPLARFVPEYGRRAESLRLMVEAFDSGDRIIYAYLGAAVFSRTNDLAIQAAGDVQAMLRTLGFQALSDRYALQPLFAQLLPFAAEGAIQKFLTRYRTYATRHVVPMLPVIGSWRGTRQPLLTLISRDGQLMPWSPYDTDSNNNFVIAAKSGSGKSFMANAIVSNFMSIGGRAWIIDKGFSYKKTCLDRGGQYIEFEPDSDICINPFSIVKIFEDEVEILLGILQIMAAPKGGFDEYQSPGVQRVLTEQWAIHQHGLMIDHLEEALLAEPDTRLQDVGHQLFPFTSKGQYGRYFNGPSNVNLDNRLVVLELQQLTGRQHLQRVVLLQLMYQIQQGMDNLPVEMPKVLLIDEAFNLIATGETKDFIISWYRQLRKFGAAAGICTQSVNDFYQNEGSAAIVENSAHKLLLAQERDSISLAKKNGRLSLSEVEYSLLETVHTVQGEYSEILLVGPFGTGIGRLVESPFNTLMFSSHAKDKAAIASYQQAGLSLEDAIWAVIRDRKGGGEGRRSAA